MDIHSLSHTKYQCYFHVVFIPKRRRKVIYGQLRYGVKECIMKACKYKGVHIVKGALCPDHVHLFLEIPPKMSVSEFMGYLKGKTAMILHDMHPELLGRDRSFWARGYYVETIVSVSESAIEKYIAEQENASMIEERESRSF